MMKYRGFEIKLFKHNGYYSAFSCRVEDGWELDYWINETIKTKKHAIKECEITIDDYYECPEDYED